MFTIFMVVSLVSLRPQLARDVWCLWWRVGDAPRTAGIGVRGVIPSLDTLASSVMCHVLPSMDICNITPFPPHCQYLALGIPPLLYGLIGGRAGAGKSSTPSLLDLTLFLCRTSSFKFLICIGNISMIDSNMSLIFKGANYL